MDDPGELLVAALQRDRVDELGDHVAGAVADDMGAENLAVLRIDHELHDPVAVVVDGCGADAAELYPRRLDLLAGLLRGILGEPDARDLRVAEGRAGDEVRLDRVRGGAGDRLGGDDTLLLRLVRERGPADEIADRVDLRVRGPLVLVDLDAAVVAVLHSGGVEPQRLGVGGTPARDAQVVDLDRVRADLRLHGLSASLDVGDWVPREHGHALLLERALDDSDHVFVLGWEDLGEHLDQGHGGAVPDVARRDLGARRSGPDHRNRLRQLGQRPGAPGVDDAVSELDARDRQGDRAGREDHRARLVRVRADYDVAVLIESALALDERHLVLIPEHLHAAGEGLRDLRPPLAERGPVELCALYLHAELGAVLRVLEELGRVEHRLRRDARVIEAPSAGLVRLHHRGLLAELGGTDRGVVAARAAPDH